MTNTTVTLPVLARWPGLGGWNLYFFAKFLLVALGMLDFQALPNLQFKQVVPRKIQHPGCANRRLKGGSQVSW